MDKFNQEDAKEMDEWLKSPESDRFFLDKDPSEQMDLKFYKMLERSRKPARVQRSFLWFLRLALPLAALVVTFYMGTQYNRDSKPDEMDFASELLSAEDVSDKINLVSNTTITEETDQQIIDALLFTLSHDESVNVRLICINTLYDYAYLPRVRAGLILAISQQDSPLVLTNLAQAINASGKKLGKGEFMDLIKKDLPRPIKKTIDASLVKI